MEAVWSGSPGVRCIENQEASSAELPASSRPLSAHAELCAHPRLVHETPKELVSAAKWTASYWNNLSGFIWSLSLPTEPPNA